MQHGLSGSLHLLNCKLTFTLLLTPVRKMQVALRRTLTLIIYSQVNKIISCQMLTRAVAQELLTSIKYKKSIFLLPEESEPLQISKEALLYCLSKLTVHRLQAESQQRGSAVSLHHQCVWQPLVVSSTMINVCSNSITPI